jgi:hypothetical protein
LGELTFMSQTGRSHAEFRVPIVLATPILTRILGLVDYDLQECCWDHRFIRSALVLSFE